MGNFVRGLRDGHPIKMLLANAKCFIQKHRETAKINSAYMIAEHSETPALRVVNQDQVAGDSALDGTECENRDEDTSEETGENADDETDEYMDEDIGENTCENTGEDSDCEYSGDEKKGVNGREFGSDKHDSKKMNQI